MRVPAGLPQSLAMPPCQAPEARKAFVEGVGLERVPTAAAPAGGGGGDKFNVAVLGAAGGIGQPLSLLLKL